MSNWIDSFDAFVGKYTGEGQWIDIVGESKRYKVTQELSAEPNGLRVQYFHEFFQEGNSTQGEFFFERIAGPILATKMKDAVVGNGYVVDNYLHFNIKAGDIFVETSYQVHGKNILVRGSSTSNAQGRFIAWSETLSFAG